MAAARRMNCNQQRNGEGYIKECEVLLEEDRITDLVAKREEEMKELADQLHRRARIENQMADLKAKEERNPSNRTRIAKIKNILSAQKFRANNQIDTANLKAGIIEWMLKYREKENENRFLEAQLRFLKQQIIDGTTVEIGPQNEGIIGTDPVGPVVEVGEDDELPPLNYELGDQSLYDDPDEVLNQNGDPVDENLNQNSDPVDGNDAMSTGEGGLSMEETGDIGAMLAE